MMIACKCLNIIAKCSEGAGEKQQLEDIEQNESSDSSAIIQKLESFGGIAAVYDKTLEFFRQAHGPLKYLQDSIAQSDLIYKVPADNWSLFYCINCDTITHAKKQTTSDVIYYMINSTLLTNQEEINSLKNHNSSYSETFGILVLDYPRSEVIKKDNNSINNFISTSSSSSSSTSAAPAVKTSSSSSSTTTATNNITINKIKQNRIKNLTNILNDRLQKEIFETDERIRRYTENQFALLKTFREKSEQEFRILVSVLNQVPDQLMMINNDNNKTGIGGDNNSKFISGDKITSEISAGTDINMKKSNDDKTTSMSLLSLKQQHILNLDTPPATPDSTPMSVGNSPTFRQPPGTNVQDGNLINDFNIFNNTTDTDCLFEMEGMENMHDDMNDVMYEEIDEIADDIGDGLNKMQNIRSRNSQNGNINSIARSLPISISTAPERKIFPNIMDDESQEKARIDIAASIKALAKSVHGDTIFGDLPRPRFSSQI